MADIKLSRIPMVVAASDIANAKQVAADVVQSLRIEFGDSIEAAGPNELRAIREKYYLPQGKQAQGALKVIEVMISTLEKNGKPEAAKAPPEPTEPAPATPADAPEPIKASAQEILRKLTVPTKVEARGPGHSRVDYTTVVANEFTWYLAVSVPSPDGSKIVGRKGDETLSISSGGVDTPLPLPSSRSFVSGPKMRWDAEGERVICGDNAGNLFVWDAKNGGEGKLFCNEHVRGGGAWDVDPEGKLLALPTRTSPTTIALYDLKSQAAIPPAIDLGKCVQAPNAGLHFNADGTQLAFREGDLGAPVLVFDCATHQKLPLQFAVEPGDRLHNFEFSPDGKMAVGITDHRIYRWDTQGHRIGEPRSAGGEKGAPLFAHAISKDSTVFATSSGDATVQLWDMASGDPIGSPIELPLNPSDKVDPREAPFTLSFSADGKKLLWSSLVISGEIVFGSR